MTPSHLLACSGCARHVRSSEASCPFCGHDLAEDARAHAARQAPTQRLSRAALYAFGVGSLTVATACGGTVASTSGGHHDGGTVADAGGQEPDVGVGQPVYGAPFDAAFAPPYGIAPPFDAEEPSDAGAPEPDATVGQPVYGAPFDAATPADVGLAVPYGVPPEMRDN